MERVIDIQRVDGKVTFNPVEAGNNETVFWRNNDTEAAHWPAMLYQEVPAFQGVPAPPTSPEYPVQYAKILYGCQIPGHSQEQGTITIYPALAITTGNSTIPVNTPYTGTLAASGGKSADATGKSLYTWAIIGSDLPAGLTLAGNAITGTPTAAGATTFTAQVTDGLGNQKIKAITITVQ
jgi:hypothetical protein